METTAILLDLHYLPSIAYCSQLMQHDEVWIEQHEHYQKGSYRNRCHLAGANGILRLSIPLIKGKNAGQPIREVRIDYTERWPAIHWETIRSAYGRSPFFWYYADQLSPLFAKRPTFLFDWNWDFLQLILSWIRPDHQKLLLTPAFWINPPENILDYRNFFSPKSNPSSWQSPVYAQVFAEKHGFLPNLSILDLVFCTGPQSALLLRQIPPLP